MKDTAIHKPRTSLRKKCQETFFEAIQQENRQQTILRKKPPCFLLLLDTAMAALLLRHVTV